MVGLAVAQIPGEGIAIGPAQHHLNRFLGAAAAWAMAEHNIPSRWCLAPPTAFAPMAAAVALCAGEFAFMVHRASPLQL